MNIEKQPLVYILSPVRGIPPEQREIIERHVNTLKERGEIVFDPMNDAPQEDKTGYNIVMKELKFLSKMSGENNRVDILWNLGGKVSEGSRVDVGMSYALGLRMNLVEIFNMDEPTGPQVAFEIISEITEKTQSESIYQDCMDIVLEKFAQTNEAVIEWDTEMWNKRQEWQRINLGLALGYLAKNPDFKIRMGKLNGKDPEDIKSYPKVIKEIERRQNILAGEE